MRPRNPSFSPLKGLGMDSFHASSKPLDSPSIKLLFVSSRRREHRVVKPFSLVMFAYACANLRATNNQRATETLHCSVEDCTSWPEA